MRDFAGFVDEDAVIRAHARVDHPDIGGYKGDFRQGGGVDEGGSGFLFCGEDYAVRRCANELMWLRDEEQPSMLEPFIPRDVTPWLTAFNAYSIECQSTTFCNS